MKRIVSILLAVCILLSLSVGILAATVTPTADVTSVKAGESVKVTLTLDETLTKITAMGYRLYFDSDVFTLASSTSAKFWSVDLKNDTTKGSYYAVTFAVVSDDNDGTVKAGQIAELTFTAKSDLNEEQAASFELVFEKCKDENFANVSASAGSAVNVAVKPAGTTPSTGYSIAINAPSKANVGDDVTVSLQISGKDTYNATDIKLSYPADKLTYTGSSLSTNFVKNSSGEVRIQVYGDDQQSSTPITLTFTAAAGSSAEVKLTSAKIDQGENANIQNAPDATCEPASATIQISNTHKVTLPDIFKGATTVEDGENYIFTAKDTKHYDYEAPTATMGDKSTTVTDKGNGTYMIAKVTGDLVISGSRTPKSFNVTVTGTGTGDATYVPKATYDTDYTFTVKEDAGYTYTVSAKIGESNVSVTPGGSGHYTIAGKDIEGDITITITKEKKAAQTTTIKFVGTGAEDVKNGLSQTAENGEDFTFELDKKDGYTYKVALDGAELTADANGKYTIPGAKINGTELTVTVEKTANRDIEVYEYVKLDGKTIFLVTVTGTVDGTKALKYGTENMFWSAKYNNGKGAYAFLVISDKNMGDVKAEAAAAIKDGSETPTVIDYSGDINRTDLIDINDAQFVWNMYNAKYSKFSTTSSMESFLRADMNGDHVLNVSDAAAVVDKIS